MGSSLLAMAWKNLVETAQLVGGDVTPVMLDGKSYAVYDTKNGITVSENRCTHAGAALCDGYFDGQTIECPLHQGLFDASTGKALAAPVIRDLVMFQVRLSNGWVQIFTDYSSVKLLCIN